jgi:hypothetical protein
MTTSYNKSGVKKGLAFVAFSGRLIKVSEHKTSRGRSQSLATIIVVDDSDSKRRLANKKAADFLIKLRESVIGEGETVETLSQHSVSGSEPSGESQSISENKASTSTSTVLDEDAVNDLPILSFPFDVYTDKKGETILNNSTIVVKSEGEMLMRGDSGSIVRAKSLVGRDVDVNVSIIKFDFVPKDNKKEENIGKRFKGFSLRMQKMYVL